MVIWTEPAIADLRRIHDVIAQDSPPYARKVASELLAKTEALDLLPRMGRAVPELDDLKVRELSGYAYRIIYEIGDEDVIVLAVIHSRRDLTPDQVRRDDR